MNTHMQVCVGGFGACGCVTQCVCCASKVCAVSVYDHENLCRQRHGDDGYFDGREWACESLELKHPWCLCLSREQVVCGKGRRKEGPEA